MITQEQYKEYFDHIFKFGYGIDGFWKLIEEDFKHLIENTDSIDTM